jgi:hypothetical protein
VISAAFMALGRSCLFANTRSTASRNSPYNHYTILLSLINASLIKNDERRRTCRTKLIWHQTMSILETMNKLIHDTMAVIQYIYIPWQRYTSIDLLAMVLMLWSPTAKRLHPKYCMRDPGKGIYKT